MIRLCIVRFVLLNASLFVFSNAAIAYQRDSQISIYGCNGHFAAKGTAKYVEYRNNSSDTDREELVIKLQNVPLPPGTVLAVFMDDEKLGQITLDVRRGGTLKLTSDGKKFVPPVTPGTFIRVMSVEGELILR